MRLFLDCSQTLVFGMFDLSGTKPIMPMVVAVYDFNERYPDVEIVVWTNSTEKDAQKVAKLCFPNLDVQTVAPKSYDTPADGDIVVDDEYEVWSEPEEYVWLPKIQYYNPTDFVRAVRDNSIKPEEF